jgi:hypothetical protein
MTQLARRSKRLQWTVALLLAGLCLGVVGLPFALVIHDWRWAPGIVALPLLIAPLEGLLLTPLHTLTGRYRYYSPFLLATADAGGALELHVATLFDYVVLLRWRDRGRRASRRIAVELLRGLLAVIADVERGALAAHLPVTATSYIFSSRTLRRMGFELQPTSAAARLNLALAFVGIALRLSFTRGRPTLPDLRRIRTATATGAQLAAQRDELQRLLARLDEGMSQPDGRTADRCLPTSLQ